MARNNKPNLSHDLFLLRYTESEKRPKAFGDLSKAIQKVMMFIDLHSKGDDKYAHLTAEEAAKAGAAAVEAQAWMEKNMNEQVKGAGGGKRM